MSSVNTKSPQNTVNDICNDFLRKNIKPTVRLVLAELPDISSTSTAHKYFLNWKNEQVNKQKSLFEKFGLSTEFTSSFMKEINRFSIEIEEQYKEQVQDAHEQQEQAISDLEKLESKFIKQADINNEQEIKINELHTELAKEQKSHESTIIEIRKQLTDSLNEKTKLNKYNESLRTDISKAELRLEANQEFVDEVKSQNSQLTIDNKELNSTVAELNRSLSGKESAITGNEKLIFALGNEQEKTGKQLNNLDSINTKLQSEITSSRNELSDINTKLSDEKDKLTQQVAINNELKSKLKEQTRSHEKTLRSYESTITGNEKLIAQLEKTQNNQS